MKISLEWLNDYIEVDLDPVQVAELLTGAGLEVEGIDYQSINVKGVVAARVGKIKKHPDSEKLLTCTAETGKEEYAIVCGDPSVREGDMVPLALPGCKLPDGRVIREAKVRGLNSSGMFCSEKELGLSEDGSAVMILPDDTKPGRDMEEVISKLNPKVNINAGGGPKGEGHSLCNNSIFEIGLTPNRSDCLSLIGFARELSALTGRKAHLPEISFRESKEKCSSHVSVRIEAPDLCSRYSARVLKGVKIGKSPLWLRKRLEEAGVRPINNAVDVTNFVMLELGQPLHAFDLARVEEGEIIVRKAKKGEKLVTLDEVERILDNEELLICDGKKPLALAGVMGGLGSSVSDSSTTILLESAHFHTSAVRKSVRKTGLHSESSHRFERGTDVEGVLNAIDRAAMLMAELSGGEILSGAIDNYPRPYEKKEILFRPGRCSKLLGMDISAEESLACLKALNMDVSGNGDSYRIVPPSYRVDIEREIDLVEEVARLKGYAAIPVEPLSGSIPERSAGSWRSGIYPVKRFMADSGFNEVVNYSFEAPMEMDKLALAEKDPLRKRIKLLNPISEDLSLMKSTLIAGLLKRLAFNIKKQNRDLQLFESGKVFLDEEKGPEEGYRLTALITGSKEPLLWKEEKDIFYLKGIVENLLDLLNIKEYTFNNCSHISYLHPGKGAEISSGGTEIGFIGEVHPDVREGYEITQPVYLFDVDLEQLLSPGISNKIAFADIATYPFVERDMALLVGKGITLHEILGHINALKTPFVEKVEAFDRYEGKGIEEGKKSLGIRIRYRSLEGTLTDEEVNGLHQSILSAVVEKVGATVR
ncbi:MAG: phenylalanine--tRNA ligase subunit beta [Deltaproteobacteria bacterium]|nr:phenylalanine--tRNA ligase subunit beta [Deltaproteobacteria bacterium]